MKNFLNLKPFTADQRGEPMEIHLNFLHRFTSLSFQSLPITIFMCLIKKKVVKSTQAEKYPLQSKSNNFPLTLFQSLDLNLGNVNSWADDSFLVEWNFESTVCEVGGESSCQIGCEFNGVSVVFVVNDVDWDCLLCGIVDDVDFQVSDTSLARISQN